LPVSGPIVIVGMGGSGLDVVARLLRRSGLYLGSRTNGPQEDALDFVEFDYLWAPAVIVGRRTARIIDLDRARADLEASCGRHTDQLPDGASWGWKHAPSAHLLPVLERSFPALRVIHVIRDGREVAFGEGSGRTHTLRLGRALLDNDPEPVTPLSPAWRGRALTSEGTVEATPLRQGAFWAALNRETADFGESMLGERYLRIAFEDLCAQPSRMIEDLLVFAGLTGNGDLPTADISPVGDRPQWWTAPDDVLSGLHQLMETELRRFGYADRERGRGQPRWPPPDADAGATPWMLSASGQAPSNATRALGSPPSDESGDAGNPLPAAEVPELPPQPTISEIAWKRFDFIDLGSSNGGSLDFCRRRMDGAEGVGVDIDPVKVATARAAGVEAYVGDATNLQVDKAVRFVSMMDFLEHLPSIETVAAVLASAAQAAMDFLFIVHPSFEGEEYLRLLGLQQYWHDWSGHTAHIQVADYCAIFDELGCHQYVIRYKHPVRDSSDSTIHSIASGKNQGPYDADMHPPKPAVRFEQKLWRSQHMLVALRAFDPGEWRGLVMRLTRRVDDDTAAGGPDTPA
jgi:hypothetical protein